MGTEVLARFLQHETDHLDGVLFIDRMDVATRNQAMREIRALKWDMQMKMSRHRKTGRYSDIWRGRPRSRIDYDGSCR